MANLGPFITIGHVTIHTSGYIDHAKEINHEKNKKDSHKKRPPTFQEWSIP
jgi:hypothetical protein